MDNQIQNFVDNVVVRARTITGGTVTDIRSVTRDAAGKVKNAKGTVHEVGKRGLKLNEMAFHYLDKLIKLQLKFVEATFDEGAKRLTTAANAPSFGKLVEDQVSLLTVTPVRFVYANRPPCWPVFFLGGGILWLPTVLAMRAARAKVAMVWKPSSPIRMQR